MDMMNDDQSAHISAMQCSNIRRQLNTPWISNHTLKTPTKHNHPTNNKNLLAVSKNLFPKIEDQGLLFSRIFKKKRRIETIEGFGNAQGRNRFAWKTQKSKKGGEEFGFVFVAEFGKILVLVLKARDSCGDV